MFILLSTALAQDTALWYAGNGGATLGSSGLATTAANLDGTLEVSHDWPADLGAYRFVLLARSTQAYTDHQKADLQAFVDDYGILIVVGDDTTSATQAGIDTLNDVLSHLSIDVQLLGTATGDATCVGGEIISTSTPFLDNAPMGLTGGGAIHVGSQAELMHTHTTFPHNGLPIGVQTMARQGLVLVSGTYDYFTNDSCFLAAKQSMWTNLWTTWCNRDGDNWTASACDGWDCDDTDPHSEWEEAYVDVDQDGFGDPLFTAPCMPDAADNSLDCDDTDAQVSPDAIEVCGDGIDNDCDYETDSDAEDTSTWYRDFDGDGIGTDADTVQACDQPDGFTDRAGDCDDGRDFVFPDAEEDCSNTIDDDCDGEVNNGCTSVTLPPKKAEPTCGCSSTPLLDVLWNPAQLLSRR